MSILWQLGSGFPCDIGEILNKVGEIGRSEIPRAFVCFSDYSNE